MKNEGIRYDGINSMDVTVFSGASELESDFLTDEIKLTFPTGTLTMNKGDWLYVDANGPIVIPDKSHKELDQQK